MGESSNGEVFPTQGEIGGNQNRWDSGHKSVALGALEKVMPRRIRLVRPEATDEFIKDQVLQKKEKLRVWLDAIDKEAVNNFGVFESEENPGLRFPFTKIRVRNVASEVQNNPIDPETEKLPEKTIVLFTPFIPPPGGGPDDIMNIIYDRVLMALPDITKRDTHKAKNITVYGLGLPTSKWGSISEEWLRDLKNNGFSEYGKLYAEFLRSVFGQGSLEFQQKRDILFFAGSMGTVLASETAKQLPKHWENLRLLLNNPAGVHEPILSPLRGPQVTLGFTAEHIARSIADGFVKSALSNAKPAREALSAVLEQRGIRSFDSNEQNKLKNSVKWQAIKFLAKGTPLDTESFRSYIEQGMLDPATTDPKRLIFLLTHKGKKRFYKAGERSLGMGIKHLHWMDPMRWPDKWLRGIESYEKAIGAQTQLIK